jgi:hypothetical protein
VASTYYLESGDFFRVNNISLGYKLPLAENILKLLSSICKCYKSIYHTKVLRFSPELNGNGDPYGSQGIELDACNFIARYWC